MGIPRSAAAFPLTPLGDACLRKDLTAIHEILENLGYKDDEGAATEVYFYYITYDMLLKYVHITIPIYLPIICLWYVAFFFVKKKVVSVRFTGNLISKNVDSFQVFLFSFSFHYTYI